MAMSLRPPEPPSGGAPVQVVAEPPVVARALPAVISLMLHVGLALIFALVTLVAVPTRRTPAAAYRPASVAFRLDRLPLRRRDDRTVKDRSRRTSGSSAGRRRQALSPLPPRGREVRAPSLAPGLLRAGVSWGSVGGLGGGPGLFPHAIPGPGPDGGQPAHHIVFVIDRSGSMTGAFDAVRRALCHSVGLLGPRQNFHVILYNDGELLENPPRRLVAASRRNKRDLVRFCQNVVPSGQTDPAPAIRRAFAVLRGADARPGRLLHLLTDGEFPDNARVLEAFRRLNADKRVHVRAYLYAYRSRRAQRVMRRIAEENGGEYRFVPQAD
jgi:hypothetical protein